RPGGVPTSTRDLHDALPISGSEQKDNGDGNQAADEGEGLLGDGRGEERCGDDGGGGKPPEISEEGRAGGDAEQIWIGEWIAENRDRKSTRLNCSHEWISYAV